MSAIFFTAAAVATWVLGACLVGQWPSKPREEHTETTDRRARPRRQRRVHVISPRRRSRSPSSTRSTSPGRYRHARSRLPKHVTYVAIITLFALATPAWAAVLDGCNPVPELYPDWSARTTSLRSTAVPISEEHDLTPFISTFLYSLKVGPSSADPHRSRSQFKPRFPVYQRFVTKFSFFDQQAGDLTIRTAHEAQDDGIHIAQGLDVFQATTLSQALLQITLEEGR
ncbi:hypothetical protein EV356DRAFT_535082 [Viridothelium virens]|uniref:Uncharacterized protein n=1 Tax=Viridothelium virens TaxID=1048519 RepID=A0A6A6H2L1_VIRVR|nr:hypothetical protein EV356DRAFT_535082 [Viridothelium virens]